MEGTKHPFPGVDYPRTFQEFDDWFATEVKCREYIHRLRWPDGFVCQNCGVIGNAWIMSRDRFRCRSCEAETSPTAGTIFADTRKPLLAYQPICPLCVDGPAGEAGGTCGSAAQRADHAAHVSPGGGGPAEGPEVVGQMLG